jgi:PAS domain S-box-containing protein
MRNKITNRIILILLMLVFAVGAAIMWWVANSTDKHMRAELLVQAKIAAQAINIEYVTSLSGSRKDLNTPAYQRIKSQMTSMRKATQKCRFLYLMGRRSDGAVFFFADSLPVDSKDYAPPGLVYEEVSDAYLWSFETKQEAVVGPVTDRWGTLVTALIPLTDPRTGNLVAVLGTDVDANEWNKEILGRCSFPFAAMLLFAFLILLLASRERTVKALKESEEKHRLFFEKSPIGIIHYDNKGIISDVNKAMITTFGSSPEKLIGLDIDDIPNKVFTAEVYKSLEGQFGYYEGEYTSYTGDKPSIIKANWIPIFHDGIVVSGVGIVEDITKRKKAEEALIDSEKRYKTLIEAMPDMVWEFDENEIFTFCSKSYKEILGYEPEELVGKSAYSIMPEADSDKVRDEFDKIKRERRPFRDLPNYNLNKDGELRYLLSSGVPTISENGVFKGYRGIDKDITEYKSTEESLKESDERYRTILENVLVGVYHRVNLFHPIMSIISGCLRKKWSNAFG